MENNLASTLQLVGVLLLATTASLCPGQPPDDAIFALTARQPYPWPAPVDSRTAQWSETSEVPSDAFSRVPGQWQQRQLAQLEASRAAYKTSPAAVATGQPNETDNSRTTRRYFPWPSSISSSWFSKSKDDQPPVDPFLRQTGHQAEATNDRGVVAGNAPAYPTTDGAAQFPPPVERFPSQRQPDRQRDTYRTARGTTPSGSADQFRNAGLSGETRTPPPSNRSYPPAYPNTSSAYPTTALPASRPAYALPAPATRPDSPIPQTTKARSYGPLAPQPNRPQGRPANQQSAPPPYAPTAHSAREVPPAAPAADLFEPARIVAMVGDQPILAGDMLGQVNEILKSYLDRMPENERGKITEDELQKQRMRLMQQLLPQMVDLKLQYLDFFREVPPDRFGEIKQRISQAFNDEQLDQLVKKAKLNSPKELDVKLRALGSSVDHQRRLFLLQVLAAQGRGQKLSIDEVVSPDEMLAYYQQHLEEYEYPAKARWERLMVRFDKFPNRDEAWRALGSMGNQVVHGAPLSAVAKRHSQGSKAADGGDHDWTTQGSLVSEVVDRALFTLPVGELSDRLEDERGGYIIRVIERRDAGRISFVEAQTEIENEIKKQRRLVKQEEYLVRLREQTSVWTIFDDENAAAEQRTATETQRGGGEGYR